MGKLKGMSVPGWLVGVVIALGVVVLVIVGYRTFTAGGPRDPATFPQEAFQPPGYVAPGGAGSPYGPRPNGAGVGMPAPGTGSP